jgi:hypothetical protein
LFHGFFMSHRTNLDAAFDKFQLLSLFVLWKTNMSLRSLKGVRP